MIYFRQKSVPNWGTELRTTKDAISDGSREGLQINGERSLALANQLTEERVKRYHKSPESFVDKWEMRVRRQGNSTHMTLQNKSKVANILDVEGRRAGAKPAPQSVLAPYLKERRVITDLRTRRDKNILRYVQVTHAARGQAPYHILADVEAAMRSGQTRRDIVNAQRRALRRKRKIQG